MKSGSGGDRQGIEGEYVREESRGKFLRVCSNPGTLATIRQQDS